MIGPFRPSREMRGTDPYLRLKVVIFVIGAVVGLVGIALGNDWLVGAGIAVLVAGVALRALAHRRG
ncbi:MAG TPA: hypothetical protein VF158_00475 [Longimicrobiales bacterium]